MDIHKKLSLQSFPHKLASAYKERQSGALVVRAGEITKNVYLDSGSVVFASSNDRNDRLGEMLIRRGVISLNDYLLASEKVMPGKRFGTILVDMGILTPEQLVWAVKEQVKEIVFSLFGEIFLSITYNPNISVAEEVITLNINTPELIRQGILSMDRVSWALSDMEKMDTKIKTIKSIEFIMSLLSLSKVEQDILFSLKEGIEFREIFLNIPKEVHASVLKFLWALFVLGFIDTIKADQIDIEEPFLDVTVDDLKDI